MQHAGVGNILGCEADDLDPLTRTCLSVMVIGRAAPVTAPAEAERHRGLLIPWTGQDFDERGGNPLGSPQALWPCGQDRTFDIVAQHDASARALAELDAQHAEPLPCGCLLPPPATGERVVGGRLQDVETHAVAQPGTAGHVLEGALPGANHPSTCGLGLGRPREADALSFEWLQRRAAASARTAPL